MNANPVLLNTTNTQEVRNLGIVREIAIKYEFTLNRPIQKEEKEIKLYSSVTLHRVFLRSSLFSKLVRLAKITRYPILKRKKKGLVYHHVPSFHDKLSIL